MFDKIEVKSDHLHLTPDKFKKSLPLLVMSHGSGGISDIDIDFAKIACASGYQVAIIDHFTPRGVKNQIWHSIENIYPSFDDRAYDIYKVSSQYTTDKKLLFGISAGATASLFVSKDFDKTFCVYPALVAITEQMLEAKNVTVVTGKDDDWTPAAQAKRYASYVDLDLVLVDGYHGFLNPRQNRFIENVISLRNLEFDVPYVSGFENAEFERGVTQKYNKKSRQITEQKFLDWLS